MRTYFLREVLPLVERDYGAGPNRAAAGESQGGFGALGLAARITGCSAPSPLSGHPCTRSGTRRCGSPERSSSAWTATRSSATRGSSGRLGSTGIRTITPGLRHTPVYLASGDGKPGPLDGDEPDPHIPGSEKWVALADDGVVSITEAVCGEETRMLSDRLKSLGTPVTTHVYPGGHSGTYGYRELRHALPMLTAALRR
ncbi:hypothetical protein NKH18_46345 [Streptomyces sp. M10(2022)]